MSRAWKTYCVLLLCVSTLKVLAADSTSSQKGKDEKQIDGKTKEELKQELKETMGTVLSEADTNEDGKISLDELTAWTQKTLRASHKRENEERLKNLDTDKDKKVSWEEFQMNKEDIGAKTEEQKKKRFRHADTDKDDLLSHNELSSMFHAEEKSHMHDAIYEEYMEIGDVDKDGRLSLTEYKTKIFRGSKEHEKAGDMFFGQQDKNKDRHLDRDEIKQWLKSINTASQAKNRAKQFLDTADENKDGFLSADEVKKHTELFLSAAKAGGKDKKQADSKPNDGRCPHAHRRGKKAKEAKEAKEPKEPKGAEEAREAKEAIEAEEANEALEAEEAEEAIEAIEAEEAEEANEAKDNDVKDEL